MAKILIVDDSQAARMMISKPLKEAGHEIIQAKDGKEALEVLTAETPDLVFLDLLMPELDGIGVLEALPKPLPCPIVVLSADTQETVRRRCLDLGAQEFLQKPPKSEIINQVLSRYLPGGV